MLGMRRSNFHLYFNPRSPWGERRGVIQRLLKFIVNFNPRSPWGERRQHRDFKLYIDGFQSTLPVGGATSVAAPWPQGHEFQSTLPVGGATLLWGLSPPHPLISIHAPRGGSDTLAVTGWKVSPDFNPRSPWGERLFIPHSSFCRIKFQSTLPVGGATFDFGAFSVFFPISIHAPRGGSDRK